MRTRLLAVAIPVLVALAVTGCTKEVSHTPATPAQLADSLLSITDLDPGWEETQRQVFDERSNENPALDETAFCAAAADEVARVTDLAGGSGADVEMSYGGTSGGARLIRLQAWTSGDVMTYVEAAADAAGACNGVTATDDAGVTSTIRLITGRSIGDESVSWSDQIVPPPATQDQKFESQGRTTVARFGDIIMVIQIGDANFAGTAALLPEAEWWAIVSAAGAKLDDLAGG